MAGWTKADYDGAYRYHVERRMPEGGSPPAEGKSGVAIHYHKLYMQPSLAVMWTELLSILSTSTLEES